MSRAARRVNARGDWRIALPVRPEVPQRYSIRHLEVSSHPIEVETRLSPETIKAALSVSFIQQLSASRVECGGLGEVASLVGDCRPPPPGNPRRPIHNGHDFSLFDERKRNPDGAIRICAFLTEFQKNQ